MEEISAKKQSNTSESWSPLSAPEKRQGVGSPGMLLEGLEDHGEGKMSRSMWMCTGKLDIYHSLMCPAGSLPVQVFFNLQYRCVAHVF